MVTVFGLWIGWLDLGSEGQGQGASRWSSGEGPRPALPTATISLCPHMMQGELVSLLL